LQNQQPLPQGWVDVGTEVVTRENVERLYARESDEKKQREWYAAYVAQHFTNLNAAAKPLPVRAIELRTGGCLTIFAFGWRTSPNALGE
jgi:hypothetical protein